MFATQRFSPSFLLGALFISWFSMASPVAAAEASYDLGLNSAYVWRGLSLTDGAVLQPSVTTAHESGLSFNVWGNLDLSDTNGLSNEFQEVDLTLSYSFGSGPISYEVGVIEYLFPSAVGPSTSEVYLSVGLDAVVSTTLALYYDHDQVDGLYASFGLKYRGDIAEGWACSLALLAGYADSKFAAAYGGIDDGLFNGDVSLSVERSLARGSISIFAAYTDTLDERVLNTQPVSVWGGLSLSLTF